VDALKHKDYIRFILLLLLFSLPFYSQFWDQLVTINDFEKWWSQER